MYHLKKLFDFIISAQVLEHLTDEEVFLYYSEEGRVLKRMDLHIVSAA